MGQVLQISEPVDISRDVNHQIIFEYDESIEYGAKMSRLLDSLDLDEADPKN